jgi:hypothetical protein
MPSPKNVKRVTERAQGRTGERGNCRVIEVGEDSQRGMLRINGGKNGVVKER